MAKDPGETYMRIAKEEGQELTRYEPTGIMGEGRGVRAGTTYRLLDGRIIYVSETGAPSMP